MFSAVGGATPARSWAGREVPTEVGFVAAAAPAERGDGVLG